MLKASTEERNGEAGHLPSWLRGLRERRKLPKQGPGWSPSRKWVLAYLEAGAERTHLKAKKLHFFDAHLVTFTICYT